MERQAGRTATAAIVIGSLSVLIGLFSVFVVAGRGELRPQSWLDWAMLLTLVALDVAAFVWPQQAGFVLWGLAGVLALESLEAASAQIAPSFDPVLTIVAGAGVLMAVLATRRVALSSLGEVSQSSGS